MGCSLGNAACSLEPLLLCCCRRRMGPHLPHAQLVPRSASHIPGRHVLASSQSLPSGGVDATGDGPEPPLDTGARRSKLAKLRAAVEALEADAAEGRLAAGKG